jgi:hypothetical protein
MIGEGIFWTDTFSMNSVNSVLYVGKETPNGLRLVPERSEWDTRKWAGVDSAGEQEKNPKRKKSPQEGVLKFRP